MSSGRSQSARSMPRSLMRRSTTGETGTYEVLDNDDNFKTSKSERGERTERKGRKKSRTKSVGARQSLAMVSPREPRKPAVRRNKSLGNLELPPELAARRTVDKNNKIRRVKQNKESGDEASDDGSKRSRRSKKSLGSRKSVRSGSKSKRSVLAGMANDDDNNSRRSMRRERIQETKFLAIEAAKGDDELQIKIESLQSKIVELKQEQLSAQSEAMKLNKEKRELKLELQRSQTVVRELRADLREKDLTVKEATEKMEALEKAVESQLDKVEDLEDELKRANDEIFTLEDKLQQMELQLVESEASPDGIAKEEDGFEAKRRERQERRLKEKEKELEERERKLQKQQDAAPSRTSFGGKAATSNKQLEQDNRMLLKALNREKENSSAKLKAKDEEIQRLNEKVMKFLQQKGGDVSSEVLEENRLLAEQLDEEKESHADTVTIKDERITQLETELRQLKLDGNRGNPREAEAYKTEAIDLRRQLEIAQQRNSLLEDEIENWKNKNIGLDDELTDLRGQMNRSQATTNDSSFHTGMSMSFSTLQDDQNDQMSDDDGEGSSRKAIGKLWNRVTNMSRRDILTSPGNSTRDRNSADDMVRSTFH